MFTRRVLLVASDTELHAVLGRLLYGLGHSLVSVPGGDEALRAAREQPPAIAVVEAAHVSALRALRSLPGCAGLRAIVLVGDDDPPPALHPADTALRRPFRFDALVRLLGDA
jgi:CheY-like chemotaxis protein